MLAIKTDFRTASLQPATKQMLEYVEKVTLKPFDLQKGDVDELRNSGFKDEDILDIVHITGFFNHINRLADALGVEPEEFKLQQGGEDSKSSSLGGEKK